MISIAFAGQMPATPKSTEGGSRVTSLSCAVRTFARWKITEDVRRYGDEQNLSEEQALRVGMAEKASEFVEHGAVIYK